VILNRTGTAGLKPFFPLALIEAGKILMNISFSNNNKIPEMLNIFKVINKSSRGGRAVKKTEHHLVRRIIL
jgi:hypothetical protein